MHPVSFNRNPAAPAGIDHWRSSASNRCTELADKEIKEVQSFFLASVDLKWLTAQPGTTRPMLHWQCKVIPKELADLISGDEKT